MEKKLTPELITEIEQIFRRGLQDRAAAALTGVHPSVLREWFMQGLNYDRGLTGELFRRCAKAMGTHEFEFVDKLRQHALGSPKKLAYKKNPDGTDSHEVLLDSEGNPVVLQEEIKSNPIWIAWTLERRHPKAWNKMLKFEMNSQLENEIANAPINNSASQSLPVPMSKQEQIAMYEKAMKKLKDDGS